MWVTEPPDAVREPEDADDMVVDDRLLDLAVPHGTHQGVAPRSVRSGHHQVESAVGLQPTEDGEPVRLVGWNTVEVAAGDTATVEVTTDGRLWRRWDTDADSWGTPLAGGELLVARGLGDIRGRIAG